MTPSANPAKEAQREELARQICRATVKNLAESGMATTQIAEHMGVHRTSIWYIASRELSAANQEALASAGAARMRGGE